MANTLDYATLFMTALDKQAVAQSTSGWMEGNAGLVIYNGGSEVKIPKVAVDGLGNYDRSEGYPDGAVSLSYETRQLTQDRGKAFNLDAMDVDETNFIANATTVMSEFQRTQVIPEIDAYRYSKIASLAIDAERAGGGYTPAKETILSALRADIAAVQDVIGAVPLVITMSTLTLNVLENSTEITKQLNAVKFMQDAMNDLNLEVKSIDNCPIIEVPSARLKTAYVFNDGKTAGQTAGGFIPYGAASVTISGVKYTATSVGSVGNAYSVTIQQGTGASVATAGVIDANGNLVITLGTNSSSNPLSVKASDIAALTFTGAGAALITATAVAGTIIQTAKTAINLSGGAGSGSAAKNINWILSAQNAPIAVSKTDKMRIFTPDLNQKANAWRLDYRKYHDLWIPDNQLAKIFVNVKENL